MGGTKGFEHATRRLGEYVVVSLADLSDRICPPTLPCFSVVSIIPLRNSCRKAPPFNLFRQAESVILSRGVLSCWRARKCSLAKIPLTYGCCTGIRPKYE